MWFFGLLWGMTMYVYPQCMVHEIPGNDWTESFECMCAFIVHSCMRCILMGVFFGIFHVCLEVG